MTSLMVRALRGESVERPPVWMMRQAGRYLPGYRAIRAKTSFLELCSDPALAAEVSLEPIERFDVDAAIVFADILLTADAMGVPVSFPGTGGPKLEQPLRSPEDVERIHDPDPAWTETVCKTIARLRGALPASKAVIGFAAAPFTLCAYMIEGGSSRDFIRTRQFAHAHPAAFERLLGRTADALATYLRAQADAGADVLQLFDTWGATLGPDLHEGLGLAAVRRVLAGLGSDRPPIILFPGLGSAARLEAAVSTGVDALSLDWQTDLADAYRRVGDRVRLQGNLDPAILLSDPATIRAKTEAMLAQVPLGASHIANLGHGIHKDTPPDHAGVFIETVQRSGAGDSANAGVRAPRRDRDLLA